MTSSPARAPTIEVEDHEHSAHAETVESGGEARTLEGASRDVILQEPLAVDLGEHDGLTGAHPLHFCGGNPSEGGSLSSLTTPCHPHSGTTTTTHHPERQATRTAQTARLPADVFLEGPLAFGNMRI